MSKSGSGLFRSALPRGERHAFPAASDRSYSFRSALPRGERPLGAGTEPAAVEFRSALPRGERLGMLWIATIVSGFDPRSRAGSDVVAHPCHVDVLVSIRAPARGATPQGGKDLVVALFRSALPRGERRVGSLSVTPWSGFRSALPRGERPRQGRRCCCGNRVSIRAPARGATAWRKAR